MVVRPAIARSTSVTVPGRMVAVWRAGLGVAAQLIVLGDLLGAENGARLQMSREVHRPQSSLDIADCRRGSGQALGRDLALRKKLIETALMVNQLVPERPGRRAHPTVDRGHLRGLAFAEPQLPHQ